jgi:hypothetical protein
MESEPRQIASCHFELSKPKSEKGLSLSLRARLCLFCIESSGSRRRRCRWGGVCGLSWKGSGSIGDRQIG